jgi:hypothetical protein
MSPLTAKADVPTAEASKYLQQLCKHFAHKIPANYDEHAGTLDFQDGRATLKADSGLLKLQVEARDEAGLKSLEDVLARHLARFAFRENFEIVWTEADPA